MSSYTNEFGVTLTHNMQGRFEYITNTGKKAVLLGGLRTCDVQSDGSRSGEFTHVNLVRASGKHVRVHVGRIVTFAQQEV